MSRVTLAAAALLAAACLPTAAAAQRDPRPVTVVRAGNLFDSEAGRMVGPRDILIRGDRVSEVGQGLAIPDGASVERAVARNNRRPPGGGQPFSSRGSALAKPAWPR